MQRDRSASPPVGPDMRGGAVIAIRRGWRPGDETERAALDILRLCGPLPGSGGSRTDMAPDTAPGLPVYLGFPWSAYIDSLDRPDAFETPLLHGLWRSLPGRLPRGAAVVTLCTHPHLRDHLDRLAGAGVTDVFWPGTTAADVARRDGPRLHPFPALPGAGTPPVAGDGPGGHFAFCAEGGNRPGLWAAIAAGLIPVLTRDGPLLPGAAALWEAAAVLHDGSPEALEALPARLEALAADPAALAAKRRTLIGIRLLHGPGGMVHDILLCLLERADPAVGPVRPAAEGGGLLAPLIARLGNRTALLPAEAELVLHQATIDLLSGGGHGPAFAPGPQSAAAWRLIGQARAALAGDGPALTRFDAILDLLRDRDLLPTRPAATPPGTGAPKAGPRAPALRVFLLGPRGQRTPLAYAPLRRHLAGRIDIVARIEEADLVVTGWNRDLEDNRDQLAALWRAGVRPKLAVVSEESLWDSLWSGGLAARDRHLDCGGGLRLPYRSLNHVNSGIFRFHRLPWFILSDDRFIARHALLIAGFAARSPRALLAHREAAPWQAAFVADRRTTPDFAAFHPVEGVTGLSLYRTRVAELVPGDRVLRIGQGWEGTTVRRQDLADWHLDKLARLYGQVRLLAAYENTLQACYVTEKPFDAFATGAIPVTVADAGHRLLDLIPPEAMLNTCFCAPDVAAARIAAFRPDRVLAEAWREAAQGILARLRDPGTILDERQRLADACHEELLDLVQHHDTVTAA